RCTGVPGLNCARLSSTFRGWYLSALRDVVALLVEHIGAGKIGTSRRECVCRTSQLSVETMSHRSL
ncbi:hypothetical protein ACSLWN_23380, partial [Salmonella enterica]|uniref:hypothetical protein n=1 Tax=Salmonella enterica TaxID=28901 RepID=UPI003F1A2D85